MKKQFTGKQIIRILNEAEAGLQVPELCRKHGISGATYSAWRAKLGDMTGVGAQHLKELETENSRLKRLLADLTRDNAALKNLFRKK